MRRRAIEPDELFETADRLTSEGKDVTATALLDALGGGSLRTIYKYLDLWRQQQPEVITASEEVPGNVQAAFTSAWRLAKQEAAREVAAVKEKAAQEVKEAHGQFAGALEAIDRLERDSEADTEQITSLKERVAELEDDLLKVSNESAGYRATAEQLGREVDSLKTALAEAQERVQKQEKDTTDAASRLEEVIKQLTKAEERSEKDRSERDAALTEAAELRGQAESLKAQNAELFGKLEAEVSARLQERLKRKS